MYTGPAEILQRFLKVEEDDRVIFHHEARVDDAVATIGVVAAPEPRAGAALRGVHAEYKRRGWKLPKATKAEKP